MHKYCSLLALMNRALLFYKPGFKSDVSTELKIVKIGMFKFGSRMSIRLKGVESSESETKHHLKGFDGAGEDGGFKSGYCIQKMKENKKQNK